MGRSRGRAGYHLNSGASRSSLRNRDSRWFSSQRLDGLNNQSLTHKTSAPRDLQRNTHRGRPHHLARRPRGGGTSFPQSWNKYQSAFGQHTLDLVKTESHRARAIDNLKNNQLPKGILAQVEKFSTSLYPHGLRPPLEEALHALGLRSARIQYKIMQDHYNSQATALTLSAQKLFYDLSSSERIAVMQHLEKQLLKTHRPAQVEALWTTLQGPVHLSQYSASASPFGLYPKAEKLLVPHKVALTVSSTTLFPSSLGPLCQPDTPTLSRAGPTGRCSTDSSAPLYGPLDTGNTTEDVGLHRTPAHTQGTVPIDSGTGTQTNQGQPEEDPPGLPARDDPSSSESEQSRPSLPSSPPPKTSSQPTTGQGDPSLSPASRHSSNPTRSLNINQSSYPPADVDLTLDQNSLFKIVTDIGLLKPPHLLHLPVHQGINNGIRRHIDTENPGTRLQPDLIQDFEPLESVRSFILDHFNTFWSKPRRPVDATFLQSKGKLNNGIRHVQGIDDPGSNFFDAPLLYQGIVHRTPEHALVFHKLQACGIPTNRIERYYTNPSLVTREALDLRQPSHIKRFGNLVLAHERKNNKPWRRVCLKVVLEITLERAFTNKDFLTYLLDPEVDYFLHEITTTKDDYWAGFNNYHGKILQHAREVIVSVVSHAIQSGDTGFYGPLARHLPSHILQQIQSHPLTGSRCYNITTDTSNPSNKICTLPGARTLYCTYRSKQPVRRPNQSHTDWLDNTLIPPSQRLSNDPDLDQLLRNPTDCQVVEDVDWTNSQVIRTRRRLQMPEYIGPAPTLTNNQFQGLPVEETPPELPTTQGISQRERPLPQRPPRIRNQSPTDKELDQVVAYINGQGPPPPLSLRDPLGHRQAATAGDEPSTSTWNQMDTTPAPTTKATIATQTENTSHPRTMEIQTDWTGSPPKPAPPMPRQEQDTQTETIPTADQETPSGTETDPPTQPEPTTPVRLSSPPSENPGDTPSEDSEPTRADPPTTATSPKATPSNKEADDFIQLQNHEVFPPLVPQTPSKDRRRNTTQGTPKRTAPSPDQAPAPKEPRLTDSPPETPSRNLRSGTHRQATPYRIPAIRVCKANATPGSANIHRFRSIASNNKTPTCENLIWSDESLDFLTTYHTPQVEVHIMQDLNPDSLNLLLLKHEKNIGTGFATTQNVFINMGYKDLRTISNPDSHNETMTENIHKLIELFPQATIHLFRLNADEKWAPAAITRAYNQAIALMADGIRIKVIRPDDTWNFTLDTDTDSIKPRSPTSARQFLFNTIGVQPIQPVKRRTPTPSKNGQSPRAGIPDPLF